MPIGREVAGPVAEEVAHSQIALFEAERELAHSPPREVLVGSFVLPLFWFDMTIDDAND